MGNALRFLCGNCRKPGVEEEQAGTESLGHHGVTADTVGVSALAHDLFHFEITSQVPEGLNQHVGPSRKAHAQCHWGCERKSSDDWSRACPRSPVEKPSQKRNLASHGSDERNRSIDWKRWLLWECVQNNASSLLHQARCRFPCKRNGLHPLEDLNPSFLLL